MRTLSLAGSAVTGLWASLCAGGCSRGTGTASWRNEPGGQRLVFFR